MKWRIYKSGPRVWILAFGPFTRGICQTHAGAVSQMRHIIASSNWPAAISMITPVRHAEASQQ